MTRKKIARCFVVAVLSFLLLIGCSEKNMVVNYSEQNDPSVRLTFFGNKYEASNVDVIEDILTDFMDKNRDIRISYESLKGSEYFDALEKRMAYGKGDDVFMTNHDTVLSLEQEEHLADLSSLRTIPLFSNQMLGQMREKDGAIYWVPTTISAFGLYCNLDLLQKHHQKVPQNLSEWEAVCDYFVGQGIVPVIANNDISLKTLAIGRGFYDLYQSGTQGDAFARINSGEEALSKYLRPGFSLAEEFLQKGYIDADTAVQTKKTSDDLAQFVKGESPFMLTGAWAVAHVKSLHPHFKFSVIPYPVLEDGTLLVINADTRLSVNADSENLDDAMRFVEYFTQPENIEKFADNQSSFSPLDNSAFPTSEEIYSLMVCYQSGRTVIGSDADLNIPIWDLTAEASRKLLSGESLTSVMEWMDAQIPEQGGAS